MRVNSSPKELQERDLYDVLADCTVLLAKCERILSTWDLGVAGPTQHAREVENRGHGLLAQLCAWRRGWDADRRNCDFGMSAASPRVASVRSPTASDWIPLLSTATEALKPSTAVELMLFDVTLSCTLQELASIPCQTLPQDPILRDATTAQDTFGSAKECYAYQERLAALEACRCVHSFVQGRQRIDPRAPPIIHWAIAMAWEKLRHDKSVKGTLLRELLTMKGRQVVADGLWTTYKWPNSLIEGTYVFKIMHNLRVSVNQAIDSDAASSGGCFHRCWSHERCRHPQLKPRRERAPGIAGPTNTCLCSPGRLRSWSKSRVVESPSHPPLRAHLSRGWRRKYQDHVHR